MREMGGGGDGRRRAMREARDGHRILQRGCPSGGGVDGRVLEGVHQCCMGGVTRGICNTVVNFWRHLLIFYEILAIVLTRELFLRRGSLVVGTSLRCGW